MNAKKKVEDFILERIKESELPNWKCPWIAVSKCNLISGHAYQGGNAALVAFSADGFFMTLNQAHEIGHVKEGEHGLPVPFYKMRALTKGGVIVTDNTDDNSTGKKLVPVMVSCYTVFGLSQIEVTDQEKLDKLLAKRTKTFDTKPIPDIEILLPAIGANIIPDPAQAFFRHGENAIHVPKIGQFRNVKEYYRTVFHELGHWTGEQKGTERPKGKKFGDVDYAQEELIAEIYSNYLAADYGLDLSDQSAAYIKGWLQRIKEKPLALMKAFSEAQKAYKWTCERLLNDRKAA